MDELDLSCTKERRWLLISIGIFILLAVFRLFFLTGVTDYMQMSLGWVDAIQRIFLAGMIIVALVGGFFFCDMLLLQFFSRWFLQYQFALRLLPTGRMLLGGIAVLLGIYFLCGIFAINLSGIWTGAGISGVLIAFLGKDAITNMFGGFTLLFSRKFQLEDSIRVKAMEGKIIRITVNETTLVSKQGHTIFVPNRLLMSEVIENLSMKTEQALSFEFLADREKNPDAKDFLIKVRNFFANDTDLKEGTLNIFLIALENDGWRFKVEGKIPATLVPAAAQEKILLFSLGD